jgi:predicted lipid-binding transport protein (Tim44 family)
MARMSLRLLAAIVALLVAALVTADVSLAQAGGGSSGFGGGGGGGGGSFGGSGGSSGSGSGQGSPWVFVFVFAIVAVVFVFGAVKAKRYRRKVRERDAHVRTAAAEAASDDGYFAPEAVESWAQAVFAEAQAAWDARDRERLAKVVGADLMVEWARRLDDFERKGWHNRVQVRARPTISYVGLVNRDDDGEDRVVVRIEAQLMSFVLDRDGNKITRKDSPSDQISLTEYWTLARDGEGWMVVSIEQQAEGDHHLDGEVVASPWSDRRIADETLAELASADAVPEGFTTADLAVLDFDGDARAQANDLSLADARFAPDLLEAAARRAVEAWAEAVDGDDAPLELVAAPEAVATLLQGGDASGRTRLVVRGPRVSRIAIERVDVTNQPATMTVAVEVFGRRYVEDRDTAAVLSGGKDRPQRFSERWTLALDGPSEAPWRLVDAATAPHGA